MRPEPCVAVPCECGRCHAARSVVGAWVAGIAGRARRTFERRVLGRRWRHDARGNLLVPDWVERAFPDWVERAFEDR